MIPGLVSISFRHCRAGEIVAAAAATGLEAIEWGADVHVPPRRPRIARETRRLTVDAGLTVAAYGSYYHAGFPGPEPDFEAVMETALVLEAPVVRVWAGRVGSDAVSPAERTRIVRDLARCADMGERAGITVATEFHAGTLADTVESTRVLLMEIGHPRLRTYWQPPHGIAVGEAAAGLKLLGPWLEHIHVFHWWPGPSRRLSLQEGGERWTVFLNAAPVDGRRRAALLEFMPGDSLAELPAEAAALRRLLHAGSDRR